MKKLGWAMFAICLIAMSIILASYVDASEIFKQNTRVNLKVPCSNNNTLCSASATANITIFYPDKTDVIRNAVMTNNPTYFNYTILENMTFMTGEYTYIAYGDDGGLKDSYTDSFTITPNGEEATTGRAVFYIGFLAVLVISLIVCLIAYSHCDPRPEAWGKYAILSLSYLLGMAFTFIAWNLAKDFMSSAPFIVEFLRVSFLVVMAGFFPFVVYLFITFIRSITESREIKRLAERGINVNV